MKIGVYGGSFNPIHSGHIHILQAFIRRLGLECVLLIPAGTPPHKDASGLASGKDRLAMCTLAAKEIARVPVEVCTVELDRPGKSYTAETLEALTKEFPQGEFYLLMGEDMFLTLDKWYRPEDICRMAAVCVSPRSEDGSRKLMAQKAVLEEKFGARCFVEDIPWLPVSSTRVRQLAAAGESLAGLVPEAIENYLYENRIYGENGK